MKNPTMMMKQIEAFRISLSDDEILSSQMFLTEANKSEIFDDDETWGLACEYAVAMALKTGWAQEYVEQLAKLRDKPAELEKVACAHMQEQVFGAAIALKLLSINFLDMPLLAEAVSFDGRTRHFEQLDFGLIRFLVWGGADINRRHVGGMTALHLLAATKRKPYSDPRGVRWLLEHGADPTATNYRGETALSYLCRDSETWNDEEGTSFVYLVQAGADPFHVSMGDTPYRMLKALAAKEANAHAFALIAHMEKHEHAIRADTQRRLAEKSIGSQQGSLPMKAKAKRDDSSD